MDIVIFNNVKSTHLMHKFDIDLGGLHFEYKNNEKECERNFFKGYAGRGKIR